MRKAHNRIELDVDYIVQEYEKGRTAQDIADELGVSKKTILTRLREQSVTRRKQPQYKEVTKDILIDMYINQKLSTRDIAKKFGCSSKFINKRLHQFDIPIRKHAGDPAFSTEERKEKWGRPLEKHNLWQGGITSLNESLRNVTYEWRDNCLRESDYRCFITGRRSHNLHAHHEKPFNEIRDEALEELGLDRRENVKDYTVAEIEALKALIERKHEGVKGYAIDAEAHTHFHRIYGYKTTEEDLFEYKARYKSGEFDNLDATA